MCERGVTIRAISERQNILRKAGLILGLTGAIGFAAISFIQVLFVSGGWYGELSGFVLLATISILLLLAITCKWPLIGGPTLIIGTLVLEGLPYMRGVSPIESNLLTLVLCPLLGFILVSTGILFILSWRENKMLSPEKRRRDLHRAGSVVGIITVIVVAPTYLSGAFVFAMGEQSDLALLLLSIPLAALIGTSISWRWPVVGGALLILLGILGVFVIFALKPAFAWWSLPKLANIPILGLLPVASGTLSLLSWREQFYIHRNHKESSRRLLKLDKEGQGSKMEELID